MQVGVGTLEWGPSAEEPRKFTLTCDPTNPCRLVVDITDSRGLRRIIDEEEIKKVTNVLTDDVSEMPKNWNRRFKYNREKIKTGDVFELAEVVRNLAIREMEKGLSTGEKQMYTRAKKILASEFMYALDKDEEGAEELSLIHI